MPDNESETSMSWPEQDAVWAWLEKRGIEFPLALIQELTLAVTVPRLKVQRELVGITGKALYEAFTRARGATSHEGKPRSPAWGDLPREIRHAWDAAASPAVCHKRVGAAWCEKPTGHDDGEHDVWAPPRRESVPYDACSIDGCPGGIVLDGGDDAE